MKSNLLFNIGVGVDALVLLLSLANLFPSNNVVYSSDGQVLDTSDGMAPFGKLLVWLIPLALAALIGAAFWLRHSGKMLAANILVWIPALPMLASIVLWGGLALLFILFGK